MPERDRYQYRLVVGHLTNKLADCVHPETIKLTVLRDPVERVVSHYYFVLRQPNHWLHKRLVESGTDLAGYVTSGMTPAVRNWYTVHFTGLPVQEIESRPRESVELAVESIRKTYDIVGFVDHLEDAMRRLRRGARLARPFRNVVVNKTIGRPRSELVAENVRREIAEVNFVDVMLYHELLEQCASEEWR